MIGASLSEAEVEPDSVTQAQNPASVPYHDADVLTAGGNRAVIRLNALTYTLHITKQGKLLLTK